jgi:hypothetical protein
MKAAPKGSLCMSFKRPRLEGRARSGRKDRQRPRRKVGLAPDRQKFSLGCIYMRERQKSSGAGGV